eukprot:GFYU01026698.1.p2 GENE.GFYU01026698.1~~GFYU01026698.1.p2  ORF type:complete len:147 (-),score=2.39 GFYU01026698.1:149-589(-)
MLYILTTLLLAPLQLLVIILLLLLVNHLFCNPIKFQISNPLSHPRRHISNIWTPSMTSSPVDRPPPKLLPNNSHHPHSSSNNFNVTSPLPEKTMVLLQHPVPPIHPTILLPPPNITKAAPQHPPHTPLFQGTVPTLQQPNNSPMLL